MNNQKKEPVLKRTIMRDEVYHTLRNWIITGKLMPETKLKDKELSETLGISRTPIREALLRLEDDGLVITKANRWTLVAPIELKEAENFYSIVWTLEKLALQKSLPHMTPAVIQELKQLNENLLQTMKDGDKMAILEADNAFHHHIILLADNPELHKLLVSLKVKIQRMEIRYFSEDDALTRSYNEHADIISAIEKQDAAAALEAIEANWKNSLKRLQEMS
ncbi:GntR family transcriptional regulator [Bacillus nakamurai]|uniref:Transcriptional regulator n=1 Tax=Bacillus nakamurai TaxID=1793963 RepID=A0A150F2M1_9BACI|nr:GntR family transcriptional regulator [Bacillus nakamurai]KXZ13213.1 transcriptional regulator [Bacillus nakamurai]MCP6680613.1 GntR family transcriptional regulator [Bacillus nakamurai]MED1227749.1 GntR family transcriptional regulator [Bacillus nakamurai]